MNTYPCFTLTPSDSKIWAPLWNIIDPPERIYLQCKPEALSLLSQLPERGLGIVGTRNPQARSMAYVHQLMRQLTHSDLIIVSGLARGIDYVAHKAAIQNHLPTIAVLGAGLDQEYPKENLDLRYEILEAGGILVTEYPQGTEPRGFQFLARNRIIAGWTKATWVVEAGQRSGALNTAKWAREQNRTTFALPCFPGDHFLAGNQILLDRDHALAFWGVHSLGAAWLELATQTPSSKAHQTRTQKLPLATRALIQEVERVTYECGGVPAHELIHWAFRLGWSTRDFYLALQEAMTEEAIQEQLGVLVRIPNSFPFSGGSAHVS